MKPCRRKDIVLKKLGKERLLYNPTTDKVHTLNPTASLIWSLCDGKHSLQEIKKAIYENFSIKETIEIEKDILKNLKELQELGLLEEVKSSKAGLEG